MQWRKKIIYSVLLLMFCCCRFSFSFSIFFHFFFCLASSSCHFFFRDPSFSLFLHISFRRSHMFWIVYLFVFFCCWKTLNLDYACIIASSNRLQIIKKKIFVVRCQSINNFLEYSNFALCTCVAKMKSSASKREAWILSEETNYNL